jgi:hypothetical protein
MRYRLSVALTTALILIAVGGSCTTPSHQPGGGWSEFDYRVDPSLTQAGDELAGLDGGPPRQIGSMVSPSGEKDDFALNEVTLVVQNDAQLAAFLAKYDGKVLRTGQSLAIEGLSPPDYVPTSNGLYLIEVDLSRSSLDDFRANMGRAAFKGEYVFSSDAAARLVALLARERETPVGPNVVLRGGATKEHPKADGSYLNAETWPWMTEDDNPSTPAEDGLSVGVYRAWDYLTYKNIRSGAGAGEYVPTYVAIIDGGFALDESTGLPRNGNTDFFYYGTKPIQVDMVDRDATAGGANRTLCTDGVECPWHGQAAFGTLGALPRNQFGSAGTGGPVVVPVLIKVDFTWYGFVQGMYTLANAIRASAVLGAGAHRADVVSISIYSTCANVCNVTEGVGLEDYEDYMQRTVLTATSLGAVVVAAAGNDGRDLDSQGFDWIPCELDAVICVGAVDRTGGPKDYSNHGSNVDIWAPTDILSTTDPDQVAADTNTTCNGPANDACDELKRFGGTSASAPFAAGVIALMYALDKNLPTNGELPAAGTRRVEAIQRILQESANRMSTDPKMDQGHLDAFRALLRVRANIPPTVEVLRPSNGSIVGWEGSMTLAVDYEDPEVLPDDIYRWAGEVTFTSDLDGALCTVSQPPYSCGSTQTELSIGTHLIEVVATDPFDASAVTTIEIEVVNRPPEMEITGPEPGALLLSTVPTRLAVRLFDPDESLSDQSVVWTSSLDGPLGAGRILDALLSTGHHTVTATATDGKGLVADQAIEVDVRSGAGLPRPTILFPGADLCCLSPGESLTLQGEASDDEDGSLPGESLEWYSSRDGFLGRGATLEVTLSGPGTPCEPEMVRHQVTLLGRDSDGNEVSTKRRVSVGQVC